MSFDESVDFFVKHKMLAKITIRYDLNVNLNLDLINVKSVRVAYISDSYIVLDIKTNKKIYLVTINKSGTIRIYNTRYYKIISLINKIIQLIGIDHNIQTNKIEILSYTCYYRLSRHKIRIDDLKNKSLTNVRYIKNHNTIKGKYINKNIMDEKGCITITHSGKTVQLDSSYFTNIKSMYNYIYCCISLPKLLKNMNKDVSCMFYTLPRELIDIIINLLKH